MKFIFCFILFLNLSANAQLTSKNTAITGSITAANPSVSNTGVAVPGYATFLGVNFGGNLLGVSGTSSGAMVVSSTGTLPTNLLIGGSLISTANPVPIQPPAVGYLTTSGTATLNGLLPAFASTPAVSVGTVSVNTHAVTQSGSWSVSTTGVIPISAPSPLSVSAGTIAITSANTLSVSAGTISVNPHSVNVTNSLGIASGTITSITNTVGVSTGTVAITAASPLSVSAGQVTVLQGTNPWTVSGSVSLNGVQPVSATIGNTVNVATHAVTQSGAWSQSILNSLGIASGTLTGITNTVVVSTTGTVPISGSITATNPSVASTGGAVPSSATYIGGILNGNLTGVSMTTAGVLVVSSTGSVPITASSPLSVSAGTVAITSSSPLSVSAGTVAITAASTLAVSAGTIAITPLTNTSVVKAQLQDNSGNAIAAGNTSGTGTATGYMNNIPMGMYNSTAPTLTTGQISPLQVDSNGHLLTNEVPDSGSTNALTVSSNTQTSKVSIKGSAGRLFQVFGFSYNSGCGWVQIHNSAAQPAANTKPMQSVPACQGQAYSTDFALPFGMYMSSGIYVGYSTSQTAWVNTSGSSETTINALYN